MPNFCSITMASGYEPVRVSKTIARINDAEDDYDYAATIKYYNKRNLKFVVIQNTQDLDIVQLKCVHKPTNETFMDWNTNSTGVNVGYETFTASDNDDYGNKINTDDTITSAIVTVTNCYGINGID